jgi:hypothetical protein
MRGRYRDKGLRLLFFEGDVSHTAQARPLILRNQEAEAHHATSFSDAH